MTAERAKYRSGQEKLVGENCPHLSYEPFNIPYVTEHTYTPDFTDGEDPNTCTLYEVKGRFRDRKEASKYVVINREYPNRLVMLFQNPGTPLSFSNRRKDGTRITMAEWADRNKIKWQSIEHFIEENKYDSCIT